MGVLPARALGLASREFLGRIVLKKSDAKKVSTPSKLFRAPERTDEAPRACKRQRSMLGYQAPQRSICYSSSREVGQRWRLGPEGFPSSSTRRPFISDS